MNQDIINYIKEGRQHNLADIEIKQNLLNVGWDAGTVEESFAHLKAQENRTPVNKDEDLKPESPKESGPNLNFHLSQHVDEHKPQATAQAATALPALALGSTPQKGGSRMAKVLGGVIAAVILLAGAGAAAYFFAYQNPERVWKKFSSTDQDKIFSGNLKISYKDTGAITPEDNLGMTLKDISLDLTSKVYSDLKSETPQSSAEMSYTFSSGNTSFSTGFEYRLIGKKLYMNVGSNPFLGNMFAQLGKGKQINWVVLDLGELEKKANEESPDKANQLRQVFNDQLFGEIQKTWNDATFVKMDKYLGREKVNNKTTLHFANTLDKQAIKNTFGAIIDRLVKATKDSGEQVDDSAVDTVKTTINALVDKLEVKQFETWIGATDFKIYKVSIKTSAPSVVSAIKTAFAGPQESSRDAKRLADIRQTAAALELYFNDKNRYPASKDGQPVGLAPAYIGEFPKSPTPADGNCTDYYNTYWYEASANGSSYELTFCLGKNTGGYTSGIMKLSPLGITSVTECPSTPENCYLNGKPGSNAEADIVAAEKSIKEKVESINFDASFEISADYNDYGVKKELTAPEGAYDLIELFNSQGQQLLN